MPRGTMAVEAMRRPSAAVCAWAPPRTLPSTQVRHRFCMCSCQCVLFGRGRAIIESTHGCCMPGTQHNSAAHSGHNTLHTTRSSRKAAPPAFAAACSPLPPQLHGCARPVPTHTRHGHSPQLLPASGCDHNRHLVSGSCRCTVAPPLWLPLWLGECLCAHALAVSYCEDSPPLGISDRCIKQKLASCTPHSTLTPNLTHLPIPPHPAPRP